MERGEHRRLLGDSRRAGALGRPARPESDSTLNSTRWQIALKRLRASLLAQPGQAERFIAEAQTIAQLHHPGIVPIYERGETADGVPYYTMPVVRGTSGAAEGV